MERYKVRNLGVGAVEITIGTNRILVDAFNTINCLTEVRCGDILLFTHDDGDHFDPEQLPDIKGLEIIIIGPPSIVKPILEQDKAMIEQIITMYSQNSSKPDAFHIHDIEITSFSTSHFMNWKPIHNSYLIKHKCGKLYLTGDSYLTYQMKEQVGPIDYVVCNLVDEGFITGAEDPRFAIHHHLSYLLNMISAYQPLKIIGIHLLEFPGTVDAMTMKKLVTDYGFDMILIPQDSCETIEL